MNAREKRDAIERLNMLELAHGIFRHLPGWEVEPRNPDVDDYEPPRMSNVRVRHLETGARVYLSRSTWPPEVHAGCYWPRLGDQNPGEEYRPREAMRVSFSPWRDSDALARDISRRLLGSYLLEYLKQLAIRDEAQRQSDAANQLGTELAQIFGTELRDYSEGWRIYTSGGPAYEVRVTRFGTVYFERVSLDKPDRILELGRLFASWGNADREPASEPEPCAAVVADREAAL